MKLWRKLMKPLECTVDLTKQHITDYTELEFDRVLEKVVWGGMSDAWREEAENMIERVVEYPDVLTMIHQEDYVPKTIDILREWYKEQGKPFLSPDPKGKPITEYTEAEFKKLVEDICSAEGTEEYQDDLANLFDDAVEHPMGLDLIYWPNATEDGPGEVEDVTPEEVVAKVKQWYAAHGKPCFKKG